MKKTNRVKKIIISIFVTIMLIWICGCYVKCAMKISFATTNTQIGSVEIIEEFLSINEFSRPGRQLEPVTGIVIHYTGNPGTTAEANRNYFQSLAYDGSNYASSHFVVGLDGEVVQCVPLDEQAIATRTRNTDTIGIEVCHPDEEGKFNDVTYQTVVDLTAELCKKFGLTENDVIRHYDVTEKICPRYYVLNEDAWEQMRNDIGEKLKQITEE